MLLGPSNSNDLAYFERFHFASVATPIEQVSKIFEKSFFLIPTKVVISKWHKKAVVTFCYSKYFWKFDKNSNFEQNWIFAANMNQIIPF